MIIARQVHQVNPVTMLKAAQMLREEDEAILATGKVSRPPARICTPMFGPQYCVAWENTYESLDEQGAESVIWRETGRPAAFYEAWADVGHKWQSVEIYDVLAASAVEGEENTIAVRWTCEYNVRREWEMAKLWKEWVVDPGVYTARVLMARFGAKPHVILEVEYASLADYEAKFAAWNAQEGIEGFWEAFNQTSRPGGTTEVWQLL
jgi:hypothetical protein